MDSDEAFGRFIKAVETDPFDVLLARWRRNAFTRRLRKIPGVVQVIHSGSLARGTYVGKIHDVDLIVVFDKAHHPDWGGANGSAQAALEHLAVGIEERLGSGQGPMTRLAYKTQLRDHVVRCDDVSLGPFEGIMPSGPPVDVMPALREGSHLKVPHRRKNTWEDTDPEKLIRLVAERKREWKYFDEVVRMVKHWAKHQKLDISSLSIEVLVLRYCPRPRFFETLSCGEAIARFFKAAAADGVNRYKLTDPTGRCGEIQPGLDYGKLRNALDKAAELSEKALDAERAMENPQLYDWRVEHPNFFWRQIFGRKFPYATKRFWQPQYYEPFSRTFDGNVHFGKADKPWKPPRRRPTGDGPESPPSSSPDEPDTGPSGDGSGRPGPKQRPPRPSQPGPDRWGEYFEQHGGVVAPPVTFG